MSSSALDQSLDQITASRKSARRGQKNTRTVSGKASEAANASKPASNARARYANAVPAANGRAAPVKAAAAPGSDSTKILVSNLPHDVNEAQVKELFSSTIGPTREVSLTYDAKGNSKGVASVTFSKRGDANKAFADYNGRLVDGKDAHSEDCPLRDTRRRSPPYPPANLEPPHDIIPHSPPRVVFLQPLRRHLVWLDVGRSTRLQARLANALLIRYGSGIVELPTDHANYAFPPSCQLAHRLERAMKIEIIVDPSRPVALAQRVAPAPAAAASAAAPAGGANGAPSNRGRGRRPGRGGRPKKTERPSKTAADLDAEMEDYSKTPAAPAA
ncbi:hypothetical protein DL93DRAFT_2165570 [Clavulina sp. PMI_390]|nr:hypothetical protein DL93DRAFT_2165570 [Clavulina sp. PMI_390]